MFNNIPHFPGECTRFPFRSVSFWGELLQRKSPLAVIISYNNVYKDRYVMCVWCFSSVYKVFVWRVKFNDCLELFITLSCSILREHPVCIEDIHSFANCSKTLTNYTIQTGSCTVTITSTFQITFPYSETLLLHRLNWCRRKKLFNKENNLLYNTSIFKHHLLEVYYQVLE